MARKKKNKLVYGDADGDNADFAFYFEHPQLLDLTRVDRSMYQEALDRFGTILLENLENRDDYDRNEGDSNAGIKKTLEYMKKATLETNS